MTGPVRTTVWLLIVAVGAGSWIGCGKPAASPEGEATSEIGPLPGESFTVLLDGEPQGDPAMIGGGDQPSVVIALTGADGTLGVIVEDVGGHAPALDHNLGAWVERFGTERVVTARHALVISHPHTVGRMLLPGNKPIPPEASTAAFDVVTERLGTHTIQGPNLDEMCGLARGQPTRDASGFCERPRTVLEPGLAALQWSDGTSSSRVHLLTYPISPPEIDDVPFQPLETLLVVSAPPGYLVYSVCSHRPMDVAAGETPPFHAVYRVKESMDGGQLPPGPIHTLVTGTCGVVRSFRMAHGEAFDPGVFGSLARALRDDLGVERLVLSHCGLYPHHRQAIEPLREVFADELLLAHPGTAIPLSPRSVGEDVDP